MSYSNDPRMITAKFTSACSNVVVASKKVQAFIIGHPTERYIVKNVVKVRIGNLDQQHPMKI